MLNPYNPLYDAKAGRSVCISNQLAMTDLVVLLLRSCETFRIINFNTDGIMYKIHRSEVEISERIFAEWEQRTGFELENDDIQKIIQKDVNNYIEIKTDGSVKAKGGYVNLYKGGDYKTNKLVIIHKAIVAYLVDNIPVEDTINSATNILDFQIIAKTGGTYSKAVHYLDGDPVEVQKVNRIYATKDARYGQIKKQKTVHERTLKGQIIKYDPPLLQEDTLSECPEHCIIDNDNTLSIDDIDKSYYIDLAKKRIKDYLTPKKGKKKNVEVINIMSTTKTKVQDTTTMNVYQKLNEARFEFLNRNVKKTGINRFAEFDYFQLEDIVPVATDIFRNLGLLFTVSFEDSNAIGIMINTDNPDERIAFVSPMRQLSVISQSGKSKMNELQGLGAEETYQRRYLYMMALDIVENDTFDAVQGKPETAKSKKPATPAERERIKSDLIDENGQASEVQIASLKKAMKKLREKDADNYKPYLTDIVKQIKAGLSKTDAEKLLIEIGDKIAE